MSPRNQTLQEKRKFILWLLMGELLHFLVFSAIYVKYYLRILLFNKLSFPVTHVLETESVSSIYWVWDHIIKERNGFIIPVQSVIKEVPVFCMFVAAITHQKMQLGA
jgi:hypothetical protein